MVLALAAGTLAQSGPEFVRLEKLDLADNQGAVRVEATLSAPLVSPQASTATRPDRILLELPGVVPAEVARSILWNRNGVKSVRIEQGRPSAEPVTRVVVELKSGRLYDLAAEGNRIVLTVLAEEGTVNRLPPVAAASVPIFGRRHRDSTVPAQGDTNPSPPAEIASPPAPPFRSRMIRRVREGIRLPVRPAPTPRPHRPRHQFPGLPCRRLPRIHQLQVRNRHSSRRRKPRKVQHPPTPKCKPLPPLLFSRTPT